MNLPIQERFSNFGYVILSPGEVPQRAVSTFPVAWQTRYFENQLFDIDPIFDFASRNKRRSTAELLDKSLMESPLFEEARTYDADSNFMCTCNFGGNTLVFGGVTDDLPPEMVDHCLDLCKQTHRLELSRKLEELTNSQLDLMQLTEEGLKDKEISVELGIGMSAIAQKKKAICDKIGTDSFRSVVQLYSAVKWGPVIAGRM